MLKSERHLIVIFHCPDLIIISRTEFYNINLHKKSDLTVTKNFNSHSREDVRLTLCLTHAQTVSKQHTIANNDLVTHDLRVG